MREPEFPSRRLRVAIVGSGPAGFFAAARLQKQSLAVEIDMFERLPTPFGLVRAGVAPDHPEIKSVVRIFDGIAAHAGYRFFGNVTVGKDITHDELADHYDAVVYATGAQSDRRLGVPGEDLKGVHSAMQFIGWYNGHPDCRDATFDLSHESVAVVGAGNVALDVARVLGRSADDLASTDIAPYALEALRESRVKTIYVFGRRSPAQAAFTNPELRELGELADVDVVVPFEQLVLDEANRFASTRDENLTPRENLETLARYARRPPRGRRRRIVLRFLVSPVAFDGSGSLNAVTLMQNRLESDGCGEARVVAAGKTETISVGLALQAVGHTGVPMRGLPFDSRSGVIPNVAGRVLVSPGADETLPGTYVVGWIKRGPKGVIGTNKPDAQQTMDALLDDFRKGKLPASAARGCEGIEHLLRKRGVVVVSYEEWRRLDQIELARGREAGRSRVKLCSVDEMLETLHAKNRRP